MSINGSQILILPPFQRKGHGRKLYEYMYDCFGRDDRVVDITVEDPNDDFQVTFMKLTQVLFYKTNIRK